MTSDSYTCTHYVLKVQLLNQNAIQIDNSWILEAPLNIAQRTRGLSSYYKFLHKSWSYFIFRISNRYQLQNLNQIWTSRVKLNFKILTKPKFRISTKNQLHNIYKTSAQKNWSNFSLKSCLNLIFKILTKPCAQSLNKISQICTKLLSTCFSASTSVTAN